LWPLPYNLLWVQCSNNTLIFREFCIDFIQSEFFPNVTPNNRKKQSRNLMAILVLFRTSNCWGILCNEKKQGSSVRASGRSFNDCNLEIDFKMTETKVSPLAPILSYFFGNLNSVRTWPNFIDFPTRVPRISWMCIIDNSIGLR